MLDLVFHIEFCFFFGFVNTQYCPEDVQNQISKFQAKIFSAKINLIAKNGRNFKLSEYTEAKERYKLKYNFFGLYIGSCHGFSCTGKPSNMTNCELFGHVNGLFVEVTSVISRGRTGLNNKFKKIFLWLIITDRSPQVLKARNYSRALPSIID